MDWLNRSCGGLAWDCAGRDFFKLFWNQVSTGLKHTDSILRIPPIYRRGLQICGLLSFLGWLLVLCASYLSIELVYPGLLLTGWSIGLASPISSIHASQISGPGNKGVITSIFNLNVTTGILVANVVGALAG